MSQNKETKPGFAGAAQPAQDTAIHTDSRGLVAGMVSIPTVDGHIPAYRAAPEGVRGAAVVLVIQEIFGLHEHIQDVVRRLAKLGYFALAPDLYHRQGDVLPLSSIEEIRAVVAKVPDAQVLADLDAGVAWAETQGADPKRLAVTGFCWGGRITWLYAAHQPKLKVGVAWYGRLSGDRTALQPRYPLDVAGELHAPVLGLYGSDDPSIPLASVEQMEARLKQAGGSSTIHVYPGAPHAFYADYRPSFRKQAAEDGFTRLKAWFRQHGV